MVGRRARWGRVGRGDGGQVGGPGGGSWAGMGRLVGTFTVCTARKGECRVKNALQTAEDRKSWRKMGGGGGWRQYT